MKPVPNVNNKIQLMMKLPWKEIVPWEKVKFNKIAIKNAIKMQKNCNKNAIDIM